MKLVEDLQKSKTNPITGFKVARYNTEYNKTRHGKWRKAKKKLNK